MRMTVCVGRNSNYIPSWRVWMDTCDGMFSAFECWHRYHLNNVTWRRATNKTTMFFSPIVWVCWRGWGWACVTICVADALIWKLSDKMMHSHQQLNTLHFAYTLTVFIRSVDERILIKMFSACLPFWISYKWKRCLTTAVGSGTRRELFPYRC